MGNVESASFPYTLGDEIPYKVTSGWKLHNGTENATGKQVLIYVFDKNSNGEQKTQQAQQAVVFLRQLRHPSILKFIATVDQATNIYLVTEHAQPLSIPYLPPDDPITAVSVDTYGDAASLPTAPTAPSQQKKSLAGNTSGQSYHSNQHSQQPPATSTSADALNFHLQPLASRSAESVQLLISAGLFQVGTALQFLHEIAHTVHGNVHPGTIFVTASGDWKLAGFDLAWKVVQSSSSTGELNATQGSTPQQPVPPVDLALDDFVPLTNKFTPKTGSTGPPVQIGAIPQHYKQGYSIQPKTYTPPEVLSNKWKQIETMPIHVIDIFAYAQLVRALLQQQPQASASATTSTLALPSLLTNEYKQYFTSLAPNSSTYPLSQLPNVTVFLNSAFFSNRVISALQFLDTLAVRSTEEKTAFFTQFATTYTMFPAYILRHRIIPHLLQAFSYLSPQTAGSSFASIINATFAVSRVCLPPDQYKQQVLPLISTLFQSPDISVRLLLLKTINEYASLLSHDMVFQHILPLILLGLIDPSSEIRFETVRSLPSFYPHFFRVKDGTHDSMQDNINVATTKLANDMYSYASTAISTASTYMGYGASLISMMQAANAMATGHPTSSSAAATASSSGMHQRQQSSTAAAATAAATSSPLSLSNTNSMSSSDPSTNLSNPTIASSPTPPTAASTQSAAYHRFYTLPSLYLSQIIFPSLIQLFPTETLPTTRIAIIQTATILSCILTPHQQETLGLTIFAKGLKDIHANVRIIALDGLLLSLLLNSYVTSRVLCGKIIPFVSAFICDKNQDVQRRALWIVQYAVATVSQHAACMRKPTHNPNAKTADLLSSTLNDSSNSVDSPMNDIIVSFRQDYPSFAMYLQQKCQVVQDAQQLLQRMNFAQKISSGAATTGSSTVAATTTTSSSTTTDRVQSATTSSLETPAAFMAHALQGQHKQPSPVQHDDDYVFESRAAINTTNNGNGIASNRPNFNKPMTYQPTTSSTTTSQDFAFDDLSITTPAKPTTLASPLSRRPPPQQQQQQQIQQPPSQLQFDDMFEEAIPQMKTNNETEWPAFF